ncbi:30S ribosomal protein S18 [Mycoplasmoides pirum]|uniref:30S ribosomal protein S18 n=1 Tax=Mycoplasmoides pirum TaxID=2122 RepID=UPI0038CDB640
MSISTNRKKTFKPRGRKICHFCASGVLKIDYKDKALLEKYINLYAKILSRRQTGNCAMHQRHLSNAIKRARVIALLPFVRD